MTASLEDFRKKLTRTMGWGTGLIWLSFAILFQFLVLILAQNQTDLTLSRLSSALTGFVSAHEGKVAIVAASPELRTFMRSGAEGQSQTMTSVLTLLASLRDEFVTGVRLIDSEDTRTLAEIGDFSGERLAFDLCYIGDQLNAEFGRCAASIELFLEGNAALKKATQSIDDLVPCASCGASIANYLSTSSFLRISASTNFPVRLAPARPELRTIQLFFVLISALVVGLGMYFRSIVGTAIKQDIVDPLSSLLTHMERGTQLELSETTSVAEVVALHRHNSAFSAIARTTQMLAHDVRKPFALFRMTLDRVKSAGSSDQVQQALQEALPEVERSLANVNGLISDVLNVGGEFNLVLKPVWLAPVVEDVVDELRKLHPTRTLNVQISIPPDLWVEADDTRLPRVFLNILSNAIEAVETKEVELWISASGGEQNSHSKGGHVEIRVGNLGSFIAPEARSKLFDLFYTSGKKGGTGLGLAIVRKIIEAHGSTVVCSSERSEACAQGKVEFGWKLARAASNTLSSPVVSAVSSENAAVSSENSGHMPISPVNSAPSPLAEDPAPAALPNVVFLDDSPLARWVWEAKLKAKAKVISFASPGDFWKALENSALELGSLHTIITDHYFAPEEKVTGIEFAAQLRQQGFVGRILLASNGEFDAERLSGIVDKIVDKQPVDWELLSS